MHKSWQSFLFLTNPKPICSMCFRLLFCGLDATSTRPSPEKHWAEVSWGWFGDFGATPDLYISGSRQTLRNKSMSQRSIASQLTQNSSFRTSPRYQAPSPCPTMPNRSTPPLIYSSWDLDCGCPVWWNMVTWSRMVQAQRLFQHPDIIFWWEKNVKCPKKMIEASWSHWQNPLPETFKTASLPSLRPPSRLRLRSLSKGNWSFQPAIRWEWAVRVLTQTALFRPGTDLWVTYLSPNTTSCAWENRSWHRTKSEDDRVLSDVHEVRYVGKFKCSMGSLWKVWVPWDPTEKSIGFTVTVKRKSEILISELLWTCVQNLFTCDYDACPPSNSTGCPFGTVLLELRCSR